MFFLHFGMGKLVSMVNLAYWKGVGRNNLF